MEPQLTMMRANVAVSIFDPLALLILPTLLLAASLAIPLIELPPGHCCVLTPMIVICVLPTTKTLTYEAKLLHANVCRVETVIAVVETVITPCTDLVWDVALRAALGKKTVDRIRPTSTASMGMTRALVTS